MVVSNTMFQHHARRKWTWLSPDTNTRNQIDYITINNRFKNSITQCKTYPGADCNSDHNPVVATIRIKLRKLICPQKVPQRDYSLLITDTRISQNYSQEVENRLANSDGSWESFQSALVDSAHITVPVKKEVAKKEWMTSEILELMAERRKSPRQSRKYKIINKEIKQKCTQAKESWLNNNCEEIEKNKENPQKMFKKMKCLNKTKTYAHHSTALKAKMEKY